MSAFEPVAVAVFAVATCGTPGPNNTLIMSSGVGYGFRRSIPGIIGINVGFPVMVLLVGAGFVESLPSHERLLSAMKILAVVYLLWLAFGIARSPGPTADEASAPPGFWRLALFQGINPKSWIMVVGALAAFTAPGDGYLSVVLVAAIFLVCGTPCTVAWCLLGTTTRRVVDNPRVFRAINWVMATLLAASAIGIALG